MGKRKLNGTSFWQCDWTGLPMKQAHCYWPSWSTAGKLFKKGSYCNWEAVIAHAKYQLGKQMIEPEEHDKILEHIENVTGTVVEPAPHYDELAHTKGRMDVQERRSEALRAELARVTDERNELCSQLQAERMQREMDALRAEHARETDALRAERDQLQRQPPCADSGSDGAEPPAQRRVI